MSSSHESRLSMFVDTGLDVLAKASVNPQAEYERATLAVFDKLRSNNCRPQELTKVLSNEGAYSKRSGWIEPEQPPVPPHECGFCTQSTYVCGASVRSLPLAIW